MISTKTPAATRSPLYWHYLYYDRVIAYSKNKQDDLAIADYNTASKIYDQISRNYFSRGLCDIQFGNNSDAINDFNKAIELDPECIEAYFNRDYL